MLPHASKEDIDALAALGNPGWDFKTLEPDYHRYETYNPPNQDQEKYSQSDLIDRDLHGSSGPIQITPPWATIDLDHAFVPTLQTLGLDAQKDPRSGATLGSYPVLKFIDKDGKRSTAASAYYVPNASRSNLTVITNAHVTKLRLEKEANGEVIAQGTFFEVDALQFSLAATKEVLPCAGTFQTPQLLELSGIGSKGVLDSYGIPVIIEIPNVGENLQVPIMLKSTHQH